VKVFLKTKVGWLVVIVLPLLVTGWLGVRTLTAEYQTLALQRQQLERQQYLDYQRSTTQQVQTYTLEDIPDLLQEVVAQWHALPDFAQHAVVIMGESYPPVWVNRRSIEQIVQNLLTNAYKYAAVDQPIQISHAYHPPFLQVLVRDVGVGIPEAWREKVFEPFVRVPAQVQSTGSGLGLSICANLAAQHGGSIRLSEAVTDGACFVVRLRCGEAV
jgi:signal transduction histidine kinase